MGGRGSHIQIPLVFASWPQANESDNGSPERARTEGPYLPGRVATNLRLTNKKSIKVIAKKSFLC